MGADLLPTIAAMAGASLPENVEVDGVSLLPHLTQAEPLAPRPLFWGFKKQLAVRKGYYKLVTTTDFSDPALYDLRKDISETRNISEQHPELMQELLALLKDWHRDVNKGVKSRT